MENKHTQGEWETLGTAVFSNGRLVSNCVSDGIHFTDEDKANAKLIAAAPDLLDALKSMSIIYHGWLQQDEDTVGFKCATKAINAINKATK